MRAMRRPSLLPSLIVRDRSLNQPASAHLSAALRHVRDAEHLLDAHGDAQYSSADQAYHLAGFGPECARKAVLATPWLDKVLGHEHGGHVDQVIEFAVSLDAEAHRYRAVLGSVQALSTWKVDCRYERTGRFAHSDASSLVAAARALVDQTAIQLWCDGRVRRGTTPW